MHFPYHYPIIRYLADFLYAWFISTVTRADSMLQEHESLYIDAPSKGRNNKKKNKRKKTRPLERELMEAQGMQTLCSAYYKVGLFILNYPHERNFPFLI